MSTVSSVEPISKTKYRVNIDGRFAFVVNRGELLHYEIKEGSEIDEETIQEVLDEVVYRDAKAYVNRVLVGADRTVSQIRDGLRRKEFPESVIDRVIALCKEQRLLDDKRYAEGYVNGYAGRKSSRVIRMELQRKGVSEEMVEAAFGTLDPEEQERQAVWNLLKKKCPNRKIESFEEKQKLIAFLARKGFSFSVIQRSIREYLSDDSPEFDDVYLD